jgi:hypothetical protein
MRCTWNSTQYTTKNGTLICRGVKGWVYRLRGEQKYTLVFIPKSNPTDNFPCNKEEVKIEEQE